MVFKVLVCGPYFRRVNVTECHYVGARRRRVYCIYTYIYLSIYIYIYLPIFLYRYIDLEKKR